MVEDMATELQHLVDIHRQRVVSGRVKFIADLIGLNCELWTAGPPSYGAGATPGFTQPRGPPPGSDPQSVTLFFVVLGIILMRWIYIDCGPGSLL